MIVLSNECCQYRLVAHSTAFLLFFFFFFFAFFFLEDCWCCDIFFPSLPFLYLYFGLNDLWHGSLLTYCVFLVSNCVQVWFFTP